MTGSGKAGIHFLPVCESCSCTHALATQKHHAQVLDYRWPGLLLQTAFYQCCQITRVHFMAQEGINRTAWVHGVPGCSSRQSWPPSWILRLCPMLGARHCCLGPNGCFGPPLAFHPPPTRPPPIDSIRDITGTEKLSKKPAAFK